MKPQLTVNNRQGDKDMGCRSRRELLAGLTVLGVGALFNSGELRSQATAANARRLDLHHHFASPKWKARLAESKRQGWETFGEYNPAKAIDAMDKAEVSTAFLSVSTPGLWMGDEFGPERDRAIGLARDMNEYGAKLVSDYKGRFGLFAVLPLPDIDASLREIEYAFGALKADGIGFLTSYGNTWLGDKVFEPVFDELNRRNAVAYTHPTDAPCCRNLAHANPATLEWLTDTARSIMSMVSGDPQVIGSRGNAESSPATRYSNVKFIWSHAGGSLVGVASRVVGTVSAQDLARSPVPNSRLYHIRRFFYDTAGSAHPILMQAIAKLAGPSQLVFGIRLSVRQPADSWHRRRTSVLWFQLTGTSRHRS